jgi:hypothetical protein
LLVGFRPGRRVKKNSAPTTLNFNWQRPLADFSEFESDILGLSEITVRGADNFIARS